MSGCCNWGGGGREGGGGAGVGNLYNDAAVTTLSILKYSLYNYGMGKIVSLKKITLIFQGLFIKCDIPDMKLYRYRPIWARKYVI